MLRAIQLFAVAVALVGSGCTCGAETKGLSYDASNVPFGVFNIYRPKNVPTNKPLPTVFLIHGGGWMSGNNTDWDFTAGWDDFADLLTCHGYCVVAPNYRLTSTGPNWTGSPWPAQIQDVRKAFDHIRAHPELGVDPSRIAVMGASAGGHLSLMLGLMGTAVRPCCIVDVSGETDLDRPAAEVMSNYDGLMTLVLGHGPPFAHGELQAMSPVSFLRPDAKVLIVHSDGDSNVYVKQGDVLDAKLNTTGTPHTYIRLHGPDHGSDIFKNNADATNKVIAFLDASTR